MDRKTKGMMLAAAMILAATSGQTWAQPYPGEVIDSRSHPESVAQQWQAPGYNGRDAVSTMDAKSTSPPQTRGTSGYAWSVPSRLDSTNGRTCPWATTVEEAVSNLNRRLSRQEAALEQALGWRQGVVVGLVGLCALSLIYFWIKLSHLTAKYEQFAHGKEGMTDGSESQLTSTSAAKQTIAPTAKYPPARPASQPVVSGLPRVRFLSGVIEQLVEGINESRRRRGDVETGYALVGKIVGQDTSRIILVSGLIDEGPASARSGGHHKADRDHQQRELELLQLADGDVMYIGDAHLHPGSMDTCSSGDYRTDLGNVRESRTREMVFVIATAASARWGSDSSDSVYRGGLKLNFFYLGKASGYEYRRFVPEIVEGQALQTPASLRRFAAVSPARARLDFENLRRLTAYRMTVSEMTGNGRQPRPCIKMHHKRLGFKTIIAFGPDPGAHPEVYVETGGEILRYQPQFLNGGWTDLIWFTPIVLEVEREITGRRGAGRANHTETTTGERSAPAGVKSSGPQGVRDHGKLSAIEQGTRRGDQEGNVPVPIRRRRPGLQ